MNHKVPAAFCGKNNIFFFPFCAEMRGKVGLSAHMQRACRATIYINWLVVQ